MNARLRTAGGAALIALALVGCGKSGRLLSLHTQPDRASAATENWREVRARLKLQMAQQAFDAGNLKGARAELAESTSLDAHHAAAYVLQAKLDLSEGQLAAAADAIAMALQQPDAGPDADFVAGAVAERSGRNEDALTHYERALARSPNDPEYVLAVATVMAASRRAPDALKLVESRLSDFDSDLPLRLFAADTALMLGENDVALREYHEAVRLSNDDPVVREKLGLALAWTGKHAEAIAVLQPLVSAAMHSYRPGKPSRQAESGDGDRPPRPGSTATVRRTLASSYLATGAAQDALPILQALLRENNTDVEAWVLLSRVGLAANDRQILREAAGRLKEFGENSSIAAAGAGSGDLRVLAAHCWLKAGAWREALGAAQSALKLNPRDVLALYVVAEVLREKGQPTAALEAADRMLAIDPEFAPARKTRMLCLMQVAERPDEHATPAASPAPAGATPAQSSASPTSSGASTTQPAAVSSPPTESALTPIAGPQGSGATGGDPRGETKHGNELSCD